MINYFNSKKMDDGYLLTNDFGEYAFVDFDTYNDLVNDKVTSKCSNYNNLVDRGFIIDEPLESFLKSGMERIRSMKSYCFSGTSLHIFAVTNMCNLDCIYCQAHSKNSRLDGKMTIDAGRKAVEIAMSSPNQSLTFEFQGGEPLINFNIIKDMIEYSKVLNVDKHKDIEYTIVTNLTLINDEILNYLVENNVGICTSLDGTEDVHNYNRPFRDKNTGSYAKVLEKIILLKERGININAIQTTTKRSLNFAKEIVKQYLDLDIHSIFLRPLTPLGLADSSWNKVGYSAEEFIEFYKEAFNYIMELNKQGIKFVEAHATYFLRKILLGYSVNYMELRSPCGATLGQMSYYYNGDIFTCDEGRMMYEMGDESFKLGNVFESNYSELLATPICKTLCKSSIVESLPKCNNCVFQPYCGTCPVVNYSSTHDLYSKNIKDYRCQVYRGILELLFDIISKDNPEEMEILYSWIS